MDEDQGKLSLPPKEDSQPSPIADVPKQPTISNFLLISMTVLVLILLASTGYLALQNYQLRKEISQLQTSPPPTPSPTPDPTANWKTFSSELPVAFKYPSEIYTQGAMLNQTDFHVFLSLNPIVVPDVWDSPFTPMEIIYKPTKSTTQDTVLIRGLFSSDSLKEESMENINGQIFSGTGEGFWGGLKLAVAEIDINGKPVTVYYYGESIDKNFTEELFRQILSTFKFTD